jgi:hypothetical protein
MLVLLMVDIMSYAVEMPSFVMIFLLSFTTIGTDIQAILRCCLSNLNGCNVGIIDGKEL